LNDEKGDLVADCTIFWPGLIQFFSQLLNMHGVSDAKQTDIHTAELLAPETSVSEFVLVIGKIKVTNHPLLIKSQQN